MSEKPTEAPDASPESAENAGVGPLLRASRQRVGEELRDVAAMLRIRYPYLEAIESGRFADLPGQTYAVGFVRAYAEHLGLDSEEVVRRYKEEVASGGSRHDLHFPTPMQETGIPGGAIVFVGLVVAVLAYGGWYLSTTEDGFLSDLIEPLPERLSALVSKDEDADDKPAGAQPETAAPDTPEAAPMTTAGENAAPTAAEAPAPTPTDTPASMPADTPSPMPAEPSTPIPATTEPATAEAQPTPEPGPETAPSAETAAASAPEPQPAPAAAEPAGSPETATPAPEAEAPAAASDTPAETQPAQAASSTEASETQAEPAAMPAEPAQTTEQVASTEPAAETPAPAPAADGGPVRIKVRAKTNSYIQVRDDFSNTLLVSRVLQEGEIYEVPNQTGLSLLTGNAGALEITVDGEVVPAIGSDGAVQRGVQLVPELLKAGTAAQ